MDMAYFKLAVDQNRQRNEVATGRFEQNMFVAGIGGFAGFLMLIQPGRGILHIRPEQRHTRHRAAACK